jgi:uncharacterized membrane protein
MTASGSPAAEYRRFLAWSVAVAAGVLLLGYGPTRHLGGAGALRAMVAGCGLGVLASAVGAVPIVLARRGTPAERMTATLASMGLRLLVLFALTTSVALSGWFERRPLLIWTAIGYIAQLVVDTRYATRGF